MMASQPAVSGQASLGVSELTAHPLRVPTAAPPTELNYYNIPFLKHPTWKWEIAWYFFLEGVASGCYLLGTLAGRLGGSRMRHLRNVAHEMAFLAFLPCPILLIKDLGRPERFYHMLRVFKPGSPMNLGSWVLSGFGGFAGITFLQAAGEDGKLGPLSRPLSRLPVAALELAGVPFALGMTGYAGALLAGTSVPIWNQSPWLSAVFVSGAFGSGASELKLELALRNQHNSAWSGLLDPVERGSKLLELLFLGLHLKRSGRAGRPLWRRRRGLMLLGALAATVASELGPGRLQRLLPAKQSRQAPERIRAGRIAGALLALGAAWLLRWTLVHAGGDAIEDIAASHAASRPSHAAPGWGGVGAQ